MTGAAGGRRTKKPVSFFEFWPGWLFYTPVVLFWAAQALRYRSIALPVLANPRIEGGGLCGESKTEILEMAGPEARRWIARYAGFVTGAAPDGDLAGAEAAMTAAGLVYPLVAKPDISCNGVGVRVVEEPAALDAYLRSFPRATALQLQELVTLPGEAGIFYIRHPDEPAGRITSVTLKYPPAVTGDGASSVRRLIGADERLAAIAPLLLPKLGAKADAVPAPGEHVRLVFVGNHCRGSTFKDGRDIVTPALTARIEAIMRAMPEMYFCRVDLRYASLEALKAGEDFRIIEFNGTGAEATHIWDPAGTLREAYRAQFFHYGESFRIGDTMRRRGFKPIRLRRLVQKWRLQRRLMASYPAND